MSVSFIGRSPGPIAAALGRSSAIPESRDRLVTNRTNGPNSASRQSREPALAVSRSYGSFGASIKRAARSAAGDYFLPAAAVDRVVPLVLLPPVGFFNHNRIGAAIYTELNVPAMTPTTMEKAKP